MDINHVLGKFTQMPKMARVWHSSVSIENGELMWLDSDAKKKKEKERKDIFYDPGSRIIVLLFFSAFTCKFCFVLFCFLFFSFSIQFQFQFIYNITHNKIYKKYYICINTQTTKLILEECSKGQKSPEEDKNKRK